MLPQVIQIESFKPGPIHLFYESHIENVKFVMKAGVVYKNDDVIKQ
jgi:hypothetical protein